MCFHDGRKLDTVDHTLDPPLEYERRMKNFKDQRTRNDISQQSEMNNFHFVVKLFLFYKREKLAEFSCYTAFML